MDGSFTEDSWKLTKFSWDEKVKRVGGETRVGGVSR